MNAAATGEGVAMPAGPADALMRALAVELFPDHAPQPLPSVAAAFEAVRSGACARAVVAMEDSAAGRVAEVHALLPRSGLRIVEERFAPGGAEPDGWMRLIVVAADDPGPPPPGPCVTSLAFTTRDVPAALFKALGAFAGNGVNLLQLESGVQGAGEFRAASFYAEIEGRPDDPGVATALEELAFFSRDYAILGVYAADPRRGLAAASAASPVSGPAAAARPPPPPGEDWFETLARLRHSIDNIDAAVVHLLAERFKVTRTVGALKARSGLESSDPDRERRQLVRLRRLAEAAHLDPGFAEKFLAFVIAEVIQHHDRAKGAG